MNVSRLRCSTVSTERDSSSSSSSSSESEEDEEEEHPSPWSPLSSGRGWGWCSKFCRVSGSVDPRRTTLLQEAQLSTLTSRQCAAYGRSMKAMPRIEVGTFQGFFFLVKTGTRGCSNKKKKSYKRLIDLIPSSFFPLFFAPSAVRGLEGGCAKDEGDCQVLQRGVRREERRGQEGKSVLLGQAPTTTTTPKKKQKIYCTTFCCL